MTDFYYEGKAPQREVHRVIFKTPARHGLVELLDKTKEGGTWYFLDDAIWHSILSYMSAEDAYGARVYAKGITLLCDPTYEFPVKFQKKKKKFTKKQAQPKEDDTEA